MNSNNLTSREAATRVGVSVPTLLRFAGKKHGADGGVFPSPVPVHARHFVWPEDHIDHWVRVNGKAPPTNRGRPVGSRNKPRHG